MHSMKKLFLLVFWMLSLFTGCTACEKDASLAGSGNNPNNKTNATGSKMKIIIGSRTFTATLYDNSTANAFKALFPLTVNMRELNGNEKYFDLSANLATNESNPGTIQTGDLMLYGSKTLVLFYKTFSTSYSYTKIGRLQDTTGLATAVGAGNVTITFEME